MTMNSNETFHKYIILGAGPGGLQMGYFMQRAGRDYLILEKSRTAGSAFAHKPRHGNLISINKKHNFFTEEEFNWRHDWNSLLSDDPDMRFTRYSDELFPKAALLHEYLRDFADHFDLGISYGVTVEHISKDTNGHFLVKTRQGQTYRCQVLLNGLGTAGPAYTRRHRRHRACAGLRRPSHGSGFLSQQTRRHHRPRQLCV